MASPISLSLHTAYAELLDRCALAAFGDAFPDDGAFTAKTIKGRRYWYLQTSSEQGRRQRYVGPETPQLLEQIKHHKARRGETMATNAYKIAVIPGDGIGKEVVPEGVRALDAAAAKFGLSFKYTQFDWSCETYKATVRIMPPDGIDQLRGFDAIFLGAVGFPGVPDHVSLWSMLIPIRRAFKLYANVRPVRLLEGIECPLKNRAPSDIDMIIVRENTEGEYSEIGGRLYRGQDEEVVVQEPIFTRKGVDRVMRHAFELAKGRRKKVTSATKSNGIIHTMPYWDERFAEMKKGYPGIATDQFHIDILCAHFVQHPDWFDVVVASNLFGDILTDLGPAVAGGIGIAPSGNLNPEREFPSMFEPVHGTAPDIAGKAIAGAIA